MKSCNFFFKHLPFPIQCSLIKIDSNFEKYFFVFPLIECAVVKIILFWYALNQNISGVIRHCVKSVQIRSFFWSVFSCVQTEYRKIRTRKTPYLDTFHAVHIPSNKRPWRLSNLESVNYQSAPLIGGSAYFKEMNNIKYQNLVTFSFKMRMKHKFSLSINQM